MSEQRTRRHPLLPYAQLAAATGAAHEATAVRSVAS